jgi:putative sterol carrier protein
MVDERESETNLEGERPLEQEKSNGRSDSTTINRPKVRKDALEELSDLIIERAASAPTTLKTVLSGSVELFIKDRPFRVLFDFLGNPPKRLAAGAKESDCVIETDERTIMRIHQGELNPQLAMVSDKINVKGKSGLAVYFFNLLGN